ncbi:metallo-hydrolase oxidoreductase [Phaffia rhodozyma]|uniref:Metallo-hydrolase oxidoreductase n=1 Tax=Phaffia rhodozyma TaxID=264483 RepID=A0A0F7SIP5_PHARH|nr:metallo-hydrolase oxidoreductase [Phaffia rhodozyma]
MPPRRFNQPSPLPHHRKRPHTPPQPEAAPLPYDSLTVSVTMLGAGQEVGRSCCVIQHRGRTIVCDAGVDPGAHGLPSLPFVDELDWSTVDVLLITHAHLDHAGGVAYIMEKTNFRDGPGKVYMTHATKGIYRYIMQDFIRVRSRSNATDDALFSESDVLSSLSAIQTVDYHQSIHLPGGIHFTPYHAGHILGASMFMIEIAGLKILYTGDVSREIDRHLVPAEIPLERPDVMIGESTFGTMALENRQDKESRFLNEVQKIVRRGGRCLLPVFVAGSAVELLLILDEYWSKNPDLHSIPIYYGSHLARQCMEVYKQYIHSMNPSIRSTFSKHENPFQFKHISHLRDVARWKDDGPCVMLASPGLMHAGPSRQLLEKWAPESKNGLILTGYSTTGSMARHITDKTGLEDIEGLNGQKIPLRMSIETVSFAQHVDGTQNTEFIEQIGAAHVVLVHGERHQMANLRNQLEKNAKHNERDVKIHSPRNTEKLDIVLRTEHMAQAIGRLASRPPSTSQLVSGLLLSKDFSYTLLDPSDLKDFTGLETSEIKQRQNVRLNVGWDLVKWHLEGMFGGVEEGADKNGTPIIRVMSSVDLKLVTERELTLEWIAGTSSDMIADAALSLILGIEESRSSVKRKTLTLFAFPFTDHNPTVPPGGETKSSNTVDIDRVLPFLTAHFGSAELVYISPPSTSPIKPEDEDDNGDLNEDKAEIEAERSEEDPVAKIDESGDDVKVEVDESRMEAILEGDDGRNSTNGEEQSGKVGGDQEEGVKRPTILVKVDAHEASIDIWTMTTTCASSTSFATRVHGVLAMAIATTTPLNVAFESATGLVSGQSGTPEEGKERNGLESFVRPEGSSTNEGLADEKGDLDM